MFYYRKGPTMKKVLFIATGGTISHSKTDLGLAPSKHKNATYLSQNLSSLCEIHAVDLFSMDSGNFTTMHWIEIANCLYENRDKYDGFIIAHGTDTLPYTASALSYACGFLDKPVAITGAQIPYGIPGSDANNNILNACRVVCDGRIIGVFSVFASKIMTGTRVKKLSEFDINAFDTSNGVLLGEVGCYIKYYDDIIKLHNNHYNVDRYINKFDSNKLLVANVHPGFNADLIKMGVEQGLLKAVLLRSYAGGNTNIEDLEDMYKFLQDKQIPTCHVSQPDKGCAIMDTYETGIRAINLGVVPTYDMTTESVTVKMSWALGQNLDYDSFRKIIITNVANEIDERLIKQEEK